MQGDIQNIYMFGLHVNQLGQILALALEQNPGGIQIYVAVQWRGPRGPGKGQNQLGHEKALGEISAGAICQLMHECSYTLTNGTATLVCTNLIQPWAYAKKQTKNPQTSQAQDSTLEHYSSDGVIAFKICSIGVVYEKNNNQYE